MRFAVATKYRRLCAKFELCSEFAIMDVKGHVIAAELFWDSPPHSTGLLPEWLHDEMKVNVLIAGDMDAQTQQRMTEKGLLVARVAAGEDPRQLVEKYLNGALASV